MESPGSKAFTKTISSAFVINIIILLIKGPDEYFFYFIKICALIALTVIFSSIWVPGEQDLAPNSSGMKPFTKTLASIFVLNIAMLFYKGFDKLTDEHFDDFIEICAFLLLMYFFYAFWFEWEQDKYASKHK